LLNFLSISWKTTENIFHYTRQTAADLFRVDTHSDGWTDRHNDANCPFSYFCERA